MHVELSEACDMKGVTRYFMVLLRIETRLVELVNTSMSCLEGT